MRVHIVILEALDYGDFLKHIVSVHERKGSAESVRDRIKNTIKAASSKENSNFWAKGHREILTSSYGGGYIIDNLHFKPSAFKVYIIEMEVD